MNASDRKLLRDAAQLIEDNAKSLRESCSVVIQQQPEPSSGRNLVMCTRRWDSAGVRKDYERETRIASRLNDLAAGISWKAGRG